jgi:hypothetical protein
MGIVQMKYAETKDVNYCIQILKVARDKLKANESYAEAKLTPSINRMILELEDMIK